LKSTGYELDRIWLIPIVWDIAGPNVGAKKIGKRTSSPSGVQRD